MKIITNVCIRCGNTFHDVGNLCDLCIIYDVALKPRKRPARKQPNTLQAWTEIILKETW